MTFWAAGYRCVTASHGLEGFTEAHLAAFKQHGIESVSIAYGRDDAGDAAAEKLAEKLCAEGLSCYRVEFPRGMDANGYAKQVQPAHKGLGLALQSARWMGKGQRPALSAVAQLVSGEGLRRTHPQADLRGPAFVACLDGFGGTGGAEVELYEVLGMRRGAERQRRADRPAPLRLSVQRGSKGASRRHCRTGATGEARPGEGAGDRHRAGNLARESTDI